MSGGVTGPWKGSRPHVPEVLLKYVQPRCSFKGSHRQAPGPQRPQHGTELSDGFSFLAEVFPLHRPQWKTFYSWGF